MGTPHDSVIRPDRLLLATDGSEDAMLATNVATDLSLRTGARLDVAHALVSPGKGPCPPTLEWADYSDLYEREARRRLQAQVDEIEAADCAVAQSHLLHGPPIDAILDLCEDLVAFFWSWAAAGSGRSGLCSSVASRRGCRPPREVPRARRPWGRGGGPPKRIVAGDDGSKSAGLAASSR